MDKHESGYPDEVPAEMANRRFVLPPDKWDQFPTTLDRGPADRPRLAALLTKPNVLEGRPAHPEADEMVDPNESA